MPDDYGNLKPISVPMVPWLQTFEPGERVRITATQQLGAVSARLHSERYAVWIDGESFSRYYRPGELRPS